MKLHSVVDVITNSSSSIYTVIYGPGASHSIHNFLMDAAAFFGVPLGSEDIKVDVVLDSEFVNNCLRVLSEEGNDYIREMPTGLTPLQWIKDDPWSVFYYLQYYEDVGEPYKVTIKNVKTGQKLGLGKLYSAFEGIESGQG